jgi:(hydroxyamino)benzene mutase
MNDIVHYYGQTSLTLIRKDPAMTADLTPRLVASFRLHGLILLTLGLAAGVTIASAARPDTVLSAHVIGITCGLTAIAVGQLIPAVWLGRLALRAVQVMLLISLYLGFFTQWVGGTFGLSRMFIVTAAGLPEGNATAERVVELIVKGITPLTILPFVILAWGLLRQGRHATAAKSF